jgi:23S rRNA pseudouridine1911/1915/1917 synthase
MSDIAVISSLRVLFLQSRQFVENCFEICPRHALHAKSLGFKHPTTGKEMYFETEMPDDMNHLVDKWRNYIGGRDLEE